jgi:hypothetical protein
MLPVGDVLKELTPVTDRIEELNDRRGQAEANCREETRACPECGSALEECEREGSCS